MLFRSLKKHSIKEMEMVKKHVSSIETKNLASGTGKAYLRNMLLDSELPNHLLHMAEVTLLPGTKVGYHQHVGDSEAYYIVSGQGIYQDNDKEYEVSANSVTIAYDGDSHGLINNGTYPLIFIAVIVKS
jgi:quercetin dioxygenase-like cupin family protein